MAIMEKIVPPRNSGRNAKRKSGGIARVVRLSLMFNSIGKFYNSDCVIRVWRDS